MTVMKDRQVHAYLRDLEIAMAGLPPAATAELREQIVSHLADAIPADADEQTVYEVLRDLGRPRDVVAEARAQLPKTEEAEPAPPTRRGLRRWRRVHWIIGAATVIVLVVAGTVADHLVSVWSGRGAGGLNVSGFHPLNGAEITGGVNSPVTLPIRTGEVQGIALEITNVTNVTQTILGYADGGAQGGLFGTPVYDIRSYPVGPPAADYKSPGPPEAAPIVFKPGQTRIVTLTWSIRSPMCFQAGSSTSEDDVNLRVHVGWFNRTEALPLLVTIRLYATKNSC